MKAVVKKIAFTVLFVLCLMLGCVYVSAAENVLEEIYMQNENGNYLQKREEGWFLFDKEPSLFLEYSISVYHRRKSLRQDYIWCQTLVNLFWNRLCTDSKEEKYRGS